MYINYKGKCVKDRITTRVRNRIRVWDSVNVNVNVKDGNSALRRGLRFVLKLGQRLKITHLSFYLQSLKNGNNTPSHEFKLHLKISIKHST